MLSGLMLSYCSAAGRTALLRLPPVVTQTRSGIALRGLRGGPVSLIAAQGDILDAV